MSTATKAETNEDLGDAEWVASGKAWEKANRKRAKESEKPIKAAFREGKKQGKKSAQRKRRALRPVKPLVDNIEKGAQSGIEEALEPTRGFAFTTTALLTIGLGVVFLYLILDSAPTVARVFDSLGGALEWLRSPETSIPYGRQ